MPRDTMLGYAELPSKQWELLTADCSTVCCLGPSKRGLIRPSLDLETIAQVFPAFAYQKVAARGLLVGEEDVVRVVDGVLLPALAAG